MQVLDKGKKSLRTHHIVYKSQVCYFLNLRKGLPWFFHLHWYLLSSSGYPGRISEGVVIHLLLFLIKTNTILCCGAVRAVIRFFNYQSCCLFTRFLFLLLFMRIEILSAEFPGTLSTAIQYFQALIPCLPQLSTAGQGRSMMIDTFLALVHAERV